MQEKNDCIVSTPSKKRCGKERNENERRKKQKKKDTKRRKNVQTSNKIKEKEREIRKQRTKIYEQFKCCIFCVLLIFSFFSVLLDMFFWSSRYERS